GSCMWRIGRGTGTRKHIGRELIIGSGIAGIAGKVDRPRSGLIDRDRPIDHTDKAVAVKRGWLEVNDRTRIRMGAYGLPEDLIVDRIARNRVEIIEAFCEGAVKIGGIL